MNQAETNTMLLNLSYGLGWVEGGLHDLVDEVSKSKVMPNDKVIIMGKLSKLLNEMKFIHENKQLPKNQLRTQLLLRQ